MKQKQTRLLATVVAATLLLMELGCSKPAAQGSPSAPPSVRLYVFDCGILHNADAGRFNFEKDELATTDMSVACFLITHPKGKLFWDTGAVPDSAWEPTGNPMLQHIVLPDSQERNVTMVKTLRAQLAELGYSPSDITYLALSHYHYDHTANANDFAGATWLVHEVERNAMFDEKPPGTTQPSTYSGLRNSTTTIVNGDDYDVFGDHTVVIKLAPGHTPGHQVLYVKLTKTGGVVLSGDLYHYPEERTLDRVPTFEFNAQQTRATRAAINEFLKKTNSQLWIQHDLKGNAKLKKSPEFYD